ncbi:MAG: phospho-sugar mutase [Spirochaetota bacterium]
MDKKLIRKRAEEYVAYETDSRFREEVQNLLTKDTLSEQQWGELNDRFFTDLSFGTGGLRGIIGGGFNRLNPFTVKRATQGLANYIKKDIRNWEPSAVIAYDSRRFSDLFALEAALVLAGNGIKTYLFSSLRPTPELSFAVRTLGASAGIVVTASHNPPDYNGYKVYWSDGAQVVPPHDEGIIEEVRKVTTEIRSLSKEEALKKGLLEYIDAEIDNAYIEMVKQHSLRPELINKRGKDLKVVYTPLHGTGTMAVERILREMGIDIITVPEQREPDGDFPTVTYPNPEEASAMQMAVELGRKVKADLVMGTDPDADRLGIAVPENTDYILITGNQLGALLADYIFFTLQEKRKLPRKAGFIKTIVTTELQALIARNYGVKVYNVLTGFKYIGEKIRQFESAGEKYIFGGEESYGYLVGTEVRDKDAVSAAAMTAEMAVYNLSRGISVLDHLNSLYKQHGYFEELLISKSFKGQAGLEKMDAVMKRLRNARPAAVGGVKITIVRDYQNNTEYDLLKNQEDRLDLPASNVLQFVLADESVVTVRPSGTEPKIKFYASCRSKKGLDLNAGKREVSVKIKSIEDDINKLMEE